MTVLEYLKSNSYKSIFNYIQKEFYPSDIYKNEEIMSKDMFFHRLYLSLCSLDIEHLSKHKLYVTQFYDKEEKIDICVLEEMEDALLPLDLFSCSQLLSLNVEKALKIKDSNWLAFFMYKITQFKVSLNL
jgi:hypothetical protein